MEFGQRQNPNQRLIGIASVVVFHIILVYALINGLARKAIELLPAPIETKIIKEVKPDDAPPPPPPPKFAPPPPPTIPPPEIDIQSTAPRANAITATVAKPGPVAPPAPKVASHPPVVLAKNCREPDYPSVSERLGEVGTVVLQLLVGTNGRVTDSKVQTSSGFPRLDKAAVEALSLCKFTPGTSDTGTPMAAWAQLKYTFRKQ